MKPKIIKLITSFVLSLIIFLIPVAFFANANFYYKAKFAEKDVYSNFSKNYSEEYIYAQFTNMMDYINWRDELESDTFWSDEDKIHLSDVRNILSTVNFLIILSVLILLVKSQFIKRNYKEIFRNTSIINIAIILIVGLSSIINFTFFFRIFHEILFRNDYWLLDPATSNLIKYFPESIFSEITINILIFVIISTILLSIPLWIKKIKEYSSQEDI